MVCYSAAHTACGMGWVACKFKLVQVAAGGDLQSRDQKTLLDCRTSGTNRRTELPHAERPDRTEQNSPPPAPGWAPPSVPPGEPKRARRSVPTQPPTWASPRHLLGMSTAALPVLLVGPCFLATFQDREAGSRHTGIWTVLYLLRYYLTCLQAVGAGTIGNAKRTSRRLVNAFVSTPTR